MIEIGDIVDYTESFVPYIHPSKLKHMLVIDDCEYPYIKVKLNDEIGSHYGFNVKSLKIVSKANHKDINVYNTGFENKFVLCKKYSTSNSWNFGFFIKAIIIDNKVMYKVKIRENEDSACKPEIELFEECKIYKNNNNFS